MARKELPRMGELIRVSRVGDEILRQGDLLEDPSIPTEMGFVRKHLFSQRLPEGRLLSVYEVETC